MTELQKMWLAWCALAIVTILMIAGMTGCKTTRVGTQHDRDSVRVEYRTDTFTQVIRDSVVKQMPCSDSIEIAYIDRWRTNTIYRSTALHDTIRVASTDTIYQPYEVVKYKTHNSPFATCCIGIVIAILVILFIYLAIKIYIRFLC